MLIKRVACRTGGLLAVALLALGGCSAPVTQAYLYRSGVMSSFMYAAGNRDMQVVVVGNPFAAPKFATDQFVIDSMQDKNRGPLTHFTMTPGENARPGYRIVVALNPPASFAAADACANTGAIPSVPNGDRTRALMAFCAKDTIYSEAYGSVLPTSQPDQNFAWLMATLIQDLVPDREPNDDDPNLILGMR